MFFSLAFILLYHRRHRHHGRALSACCFRDYCLLFGFFFLLPRKVIFIANTFARARVCIRSIVNFLFVYVHQNSTGYCSCARLSC